MGRGRTVSVVRPTDTGRHRGLAYTLWLPPAPRGAIVIVHGAGSSKESHHDFARAAMPLGLASLCFDLRGHGDSDSPMDGRALEDVVAMGELVADRIGRPAPPLALRGSSLGGYLALAAAEQARAAAVVAICPAPAELLRTGLARGAFAFAADVGSLDRLLEEHDLVTAVARLSVPVMLLHAEGDERVPVEVSRELGGQLRHPASRLIALPGGHHRSIQHDREMQAVSLRFIEQALRRESGRS